MLVVSPLAAAPFNQAANPNPNPNPIPNLNSNPNSNPHPHPHPSPRPRPHPNPNPNQEVVAPVAAGAVDGLGGGAVADALLNALVYPREL